LITPGPVSVEKFIPGGISPLSILQEAGSAIVPETVNTAPLEGTPTVAVSEDGLELIPEAPTSVCTDPSEATATNADFRIDVAGKEGTASSPSDIRLSTGVFCRNITRNVTGKFSHGRRVRKDANNLNIVILAAKLSVFNRQAYLGLYPRIKFK